MESPSQIALARNAEFLAHAKEMDPVLAAAALDHSLTSGDSFEDSFAHLRRRAGLIEQAAKRVVRDAANAPGSALAGIRDALATLDLGANKPFPHEKYRPAATRAPHALRAARKRQRQGRKAARR